MQTQNYSYFHKDRAKKKRAKKHISTKQQNQNWPAISWKTKFDLLWKCIIFCNIRQSKAEKVDKVFLVKQQTNLVKTWLGEGVEGQL